MIEIIYRLVTTMFMLAINKNMYEEWDMNVKLGDDGVTATSILACCCPPTWGPASSIPLTISSLLAASSSLTRDLPVSDALEEGEI